MMPDLQLPSDPHAETTILGAVMLDNTAFYQATEAGIQTEDFALDSHQRIWQRMGELMESGRPVDMVTLPHEMARHKEIETCGGVAYIASLTEGLPRRPVIAEYVRIVIDKADARRLMLVAQQAIERAAEQSEPSEGLINAAIEELEGTSRAGRKSGRPVAEILVDDRDLMERQFNATQVTLGASLFTSEIDRITGGIQDEELCLLAARPGQGKTEAAIQCIVNNARRGLRVHVFSLEMTAQQLVRRMTRLVAQVPVMKMRDPRTLTPGERYQLSQAREEIIDLPIVIDDTHELTYGDFRSRAVLAAKRGQADLLVIDYGQLLLVPKAKNMIEEAKKQAETLRHIARDYCRTLALAQLRRAPPNDLNLYPDIEMIYGSSAWEQAAQLILLLHRTRHEKRYTGEDYCFIGKMRESQSIEPLGIKAEKWGEFRDRYAEGESPADYSDRRIGSHA